MPPHLHKRSLAFLRCLSRAVDGRDHRTELWGARSMQGTAQLGARLHRAPVAALPLVVEGFPLRTEHFFPARDTPGVANRRKRAFRRVWMAGDGETTLGGAGCGGWWRAVPRYRGGRWRCELEIGELAPERVIEIIEGHERCAQEIVSPPVGAHRATLTALEGES